MKKLLFILMMAPFILFSCKKEHGLSLKTSAAKKYAVTIRVANFTLKHTNYALRTKAIHLASSSDTLTNLASYVDKLYYVVLDSNFNVVKTIAQDSTMANMGVITDSLSAGHYQIAMVAGKKGLEVVTNPSLGNFYDYAGKAWQDTFWGTFAIIVGDHDISLTPTLNRVVGKLEVTILDNMPANADSLFISVDGDATQTFLLDSAFFTSQTTTFPVFIPASAKGQPNFTVDRLIGGIDFGFNVTITCKDAGGNVIKSVTASSIVINPNEKTILSGDLFTGSGGSGSTQSFTAKADTAWNSTPNQVSFSLRRH
jgi:hypothetical protein